MISSHAIVGENTTVDYYKQQLLLTPRSNVDSKQYSFLRNTKYILMPRYVFCTSTRRNSSIRLFLTSKTRFRHRIPITPDNGAKNILQAKRTKVCPDNMHKCPHTFLHVNVTQFGRLEAPYA